MINVAKMTKSQAKKSIQAIIVKSSKVFLNTDAFSTSDFIAMDKILVKALKRLK